MEHSQKVCPVEVQRQLDPYYRQSRGQPARCEMGPRFCAIMEFVLQFPVERRVGLQRVESMAITGKDVLLINGIASGTGTALEKQLREWAYRTGITGMDADRHKVESFNAMLNANIGRKAGVRAIEI